MIAAKMHSALNGGPLSQFGASMWSSMRAAQSGWVRRWWQSTMRLTRVRACSINQARTRFSFRRVRGAPRRRRRAGTCGSGG